MSKKSFRITLVLAALLGIVFSAYAQEDLIPAVAPPSVLFEVLALNHDLPTIKKPKYRSPIALVPSPDSSVIYICEKTAKRISVFNVASGEVTGYFHLPNEVNGCAVSSDGGTIYATCGSENWPNGMMCEVSVATGKVTRRISVGHYPRSPVLTPDGAKLYVCNMFSNNLSVIDLVSGVEKKINVVREPYAADITPDGTMLAVGNSLPDDRSTDTNDVSCQISLIDVVNDTVYKHIKLTRGSHSVFGLTISADGKYAFATHLIGKFNLVASTVAQGWLHTNNIAVIDLEQQRFVNDVCLDLSTIGMGNPWGIKCTKDGEFMVVAHAGCNELSIIQYKPFIDTVIARSAAGIDLQQNFTTMVKSRERVPVGTRQPRALAIIGKKVYTAGYFDDPGARLERYVINVGSDYFPKTYLIGEKQAWTGEREGDNNFYDAALCFQKWQSCHSCHPLTRPDALNWILGGGAAQFPKNAKTMLYSWWTPPTTWTGRRGHAEASIKAGIELELFQAPTDKVADPLDTLFMYLKPMPSPKLVKGRLSESAMRGKKIFYDRNKVDCIICHPPPLFCDKIQRQTTIPDPYDANINWVTPHLREAWRTGPYGHIGGQWGIREVLEIRGHSTNYLDLDIQEQEDLVEYVESL